MASNKYIDRLAAEFTHSASGERMVSLELSYLVPNLAVSDPWIKAVRTGLERVGKEFVDTRILPSGAAQLGNRVLVSPDYYPGLAEPFIFRKYKNYLSSIVVGSYFSDIGQGNGQKAKDLFDVVGSPAFWHGCDISDANNAMATALMQTFMPARDVKTEAISFFSEAFLRSSRWFEPMRRSLKHSVGILGFTPNNVAPPLTQQLITSVSRKLRPPSGSFEGDHLLIAADHTDNREKIEAAYETDELKQLHLNGMAHACRVKGIQIPDFRFFSYHARWSADDCRVHMSLRSLVEQPLYRVTPSIFNEAGIDTVSVSERVAMVVQKGEVIQTGFADKLPELSFKQILRDSGSHIRREMPYRGEDGRLNCILYHLQAG